MAEENFNPKELLERYRNQRDRLLGLASYNKMISEEEQLKEIEALKRTTRNERFFFVVNLHKMELEHQYGVERWLGYNDKNFDFYTYLTKIHPSHAAGHNITSTTLIEGLMNGDWPIEYLKHRYVTNIALRHSDGTYKLCKRLAVIFQYDENNRLLEFINEYTIIKEYEGEPFTVRANDDSGNELEWLKEFLERVKNLFNDKNLFSAKELKILREYAYDQNISVGEIAEFLGSAPGTIIKQNKEILNKAEILLKYRFKTTSQVAYVLRQQGFL